MIPSVQNVEPTHSNPPLTTVITPPQAEDVSSMGGWVWIVLFGMLILLAIIPNFLLFGLTTFNKSKRNFLYFLFNFLFFLNVVDNIILSFEFSLGIEHQFPYSESLCTIHKTILRNIPVLQALTIVVILFYTKNHFLINRRINDGAIRNECSGSLATNIAWFTLGFVLMAVIFSLPTINFAGLILDESKQEQYCVVLPSVYGQNLSSIYYLFYSAIFSYWLPLLISIPLIWQLMSAGSGRKFPEISLALSVCVSYFVFFLPYASVVTARHTMIIMDISLTQNQSYLLKVSQSLCLLLAYFWHMTRAGLVLIMEPDLKYALMNSKCCQLIPKLDPFSNENDASVQTDVEMQVPLCMVHRSHDSKIVIFKSTADNGNSFDDEYDDPTSENAKLASNA